MPFSNRPREADGNNGLNRRMFRSITADNNRSMRGNGNGNGNGHHRPQQQQRTAPPDVTNAENFYYLKQMNAKTPMVFIMTLMFITSLIWLVVPLLVGLRVLLRSEVK